MSSSESDNSKNSFDELTRPLARLGRSLQETARLLEIMKQSNEELKDFNHSFGAFLHGLAGVNLVNEWAFNGNESNNNNNNNNNNKNKHTRSVSFDERTIAPMPTTSASTPTPTTSTTRGGLKRSATRSGVDLRKRKKTAEPTLSKPQQEEIETIIQKLPIEFRDQTDYLKDVRTILRLFFLKLDGFTLKEMAETSKVPQHRVTKCVNALIHAKIVLKKLPAQRGQYSKFQLSNGVSSAY